MGTLAQCRSTRSRTTPFGLWRFASEYLLAARAVRAAYDEKLLFPLLYLYGLSIELSLKAFLLRRGVSLASVRALSHGLPQVLGASRRRKLGREVKLSNHYLAAIKVLAVTYSSNQLRYIEIGSTIVPQVALISETAEAIVIGTERYCTGHSVFTRRVRPNLSVDTDAPRARLRQRSGSPVTLVR